MAEKINVRPAIIVIKKDKVLVVKSKYRDEEFYLFPLLITFYICFCFFSKFPHKV